MDDSLSLRRRLDPDILKKFYGSTLWGVVSPIYFIYFISYSIIWILTTLLRERELKEHLKTN